MLTVVKLWKIFNVKHPRKGERLNGPLCQPIASVDDPKLKWLRSIHSWLSAWENLNIPRRQRVLSKETMFALKHTVSTACDLAEYLMTKLKLQYVLLGKFQTDNLEFRFSQYRQMSGANYNVSVTQVMEAEKKLRILSVMKIMKCRDATFTLRDFITSCQGEKVDDDVTSSDLDNACQTQLSHFNSVVDDCDDVIITDSEMSGIIFIAGYIGFKLKPKLSCIDCRLELLTDRALDCDFPRDDSFNYMASIDQGGLTWPTDLLVDSGPECNCFQMFDLRQTCDAFQQCTESPISHDATCDSALFTSFVIVWSMSIMRLNAVRHCQNLHQNC